MAHRNEITTAETHACHKQNGEFKMAEWDTFSVVQPKQEIKKIIIKIVYEINLWN